MTPAKFPPRVYLTTNQIHKSNAPRIQGAGFGIPASWEYVSIEEHEHLIRKARAEAFEEAAQMLRQECKDLSYLTGCDPGHNFVHPTKFMGWTISLILDDKAKAARAAAEGQGAK